MKFKVIITEGEDGYYVVRCPALQGCISQGKTVEEAMENIKEAIELCLEVERDETKQLQKGEQIVDVEV
ncbi:MAG: type II toxin-antitoxin system HicB family antitoxin [Candidatus Hydrothermarchaeales archaeon]